MQLSLEVEQDRARYFGLLSAVEDLVEGLLEDKALELLASWDTHPFAQLQWFMDDLGGWPHVGSPYEASQTHVMFFVFKEDCLSDLKDECLRRIHGVARQVIASWPEPMRSVVVKACSLDEDLVAPLEISKVQLEEAAADRLAGKVVELFLYSDQDILIAA